MTREPDGSYVLHLEGTPWALTWQGPRLLETQLLTANLTFKPTYAHAAHERTFLSRAMTRSRHGWVLAAPACDVEGEVVVVEAQGEPTRLKFAGRGYHDHNFGLGPLGPGLSKWVWGRVLLNDRVVTFHYARPRDRRLPVEVHLVQADSGEVRELAVDRARVDWSRRTPLGLAYPDRLAFDDTLVLESPRVVDGSPFYLRLTYAARVGGQRGIAFCEVAYPHRLRWPVLGRMIEMSIDKRPMHEKARG